MVFNILDWRGERLQVVTPLGITGGGAILFSVHRSITVNRWHRDRFLATGDGIKITRVVNTIMPDDAAISKTKNKDAKGGSMGFSTTRLQVPKFRIQKLGEEGQLNAIPCSRAEGERSGWTHLGLLSLDPMLMTAAHRKTRNKKAGRTGVRVEISTIVRKTGQGPRE